MTITGVQIPSAPALSVVVSYFNPKRIPRVLAMVRFALECLAEYTKSSPLELILSDGSGGACEVLQTEAGARGWVYLCFPEQVGFAEGYNAGLRQAHGRYRAIMASDVFVTPGWDAILLAEMQRTEAWMASPYLSATDYPAQARLSFISKMRTFRPCFMTFNLNVFTADCLQKLGPIDGQLSGYYNDIDYLLRIYRAGGQAIIADAGQIVHIGRASLSVATNASYQHDQRIFFERYPDLRRKKFDDLYDYTHPDVCRSGIYRCIVRGAGRVLSGQRWRKIRNLLSRAEPYLNRA